MRPDDLRDAVAARAAGEDLPGLDPAALDARLAADPALRAELDDLGRLCAALRAAPAPAVRPATGPAGSRRGGASLSKPGGPVVPKRGGPVSRRAAPKRIDRLPARRAPWCLAIAAAAAAAAVIAMALFLRERDGGAPLEPPPQPQLPSIAAAVPPPEAVEAIDLLREPLPGEKGPPQIRLGGGTSGGGPADTALEDPVLAQVDFPVRLPAEMPAGFELKEIRVRRAAVAGRDLVRLAWDGSKARLVLVEVPAGPGVREALQLVPAPEGATLRIDEVGSTVVLIGAAGLSEDLLDTIAGSLR